MPPRQGAPLDARMTAILAALAGEESSLRSAEAGPDPLTHALGGAA